MFDYSTVKSKFGEFSIKDKILCGAEVDYKFQTTHVGKVILNTLKESPEHVSQIDADTDKKTTFNEMENCSIRCALWLEKQGIGHDDIVTICTYNSPETYIPIFASLYVGAIFNNWYHDITIKSARHFMKLLKPKVVFTCEDAAKTLIEAAKMENLNPKFIVFGKYNGIESLDDIINSQTVEEVQNFQPKNIDKPEETIGMICLSSGSTGLPKGVMHSYAVLLKNILLFAPLPINRTALSYSNPYWSTYVSLLMQSLAFKGTRVIHKTFNSEETCKVIDKYKVNIMFVSPVMTNELVKSNVLSKYDLKSLEYIISTGSKVNLSVYKEFKKILKHALVVQTYGLSETFSCIAVQTEKSKSDDSIGFVGPNSKIKVVHLENGETLGVGDKGEICMKPANITKGYYNDPEKTKETFDNGGWFHTGDIGYYNNDGELFIVDRIKEVMKYQNHQISPTEIEEVLLSNPGVEQVAVVPVPHEIDGEHPMAFVKKTPGCEVSENDLIELSAVLGENKKLRGGVKFLEMMPKTASGKISKAELKEIAKNMAKGS